MKSVSKELEKLLIADWIGPPPPAGAILTPVDIFPPKPDEPKPGDMWLEGDENDEPRVMICVDKKWLEEAMEFWKTPIKK